MKRYIVALTLTLGIATAVKAETGAESLIQSIKNKINEGMQGLGEAVSSAIGEPQQQRLKEAVNNAVQDAHTTYQNAVKQQQATVEMINAKVREVIEKKQIAAQQVLTDIQNQYAQANTAINQSLEKLRTSYEAAEKLATDAYNQAVSEAQQAKAQLDALKAKAADSALVDGAQRMYAAAQKRVSVAKDELTSIINQATDSAAKLKTEGANTLKSLEDKATKIEQVVQNAKDVATQKAQQGFSNTLNSIKEKAREQSQKITDWVNAQKQKRQNIK